MIWIEGVRKQVINRIKPFQMEGAFLIDKTRNLTDSTPEALNSEVPRPSLRSSVGNGEAGYRCLRQAGDQGAFSR